MRSFDLRVGLARQLHPIKISLLNTFAYFITALLSIATICIAESFKFVSQAGSDKRTISIAKFPAKMWISKVTMLIESNYYQVNLHEA